MFSRTQVPCLNIRVSDTVNIERENNIQDKKKCEKQDKNVLVKWTGVLSSACLAWLECFT